MTKRILNYALICAFSACSAFSASFVNGNFEAGNASGWTIGGGDRTSEDNPVNVASLQPGGSLYNASIANSHSAIVTPGLDANTGNQLNRVYSGNYSWRIEDTVSGGYASTISQTVLNYTDPQIFFAWAAVLEGAHGPDEAATFQVVLTDITAGDQLISRQYNAGTTGSGVDSRFIYNASTNFYWTPWQVEQITLPTDRLGHDFALSVLAADCSLAGHTGYAYLDGFGAVAPSPVSDTPEPSSIFLLSTGFAGLSAAYFRRRQAA
jgi:hypothetical protein